MAHFGIGAARVRQVPNHARLRLLLVVAAEAAQFHSWALATVHEGETVLIGGKCEAVKLLATHGLC